LRQCKQSQAYAIWRRLGEATQELFEVIFREVPWDASLPSSSPISVDVRYQLYVSQTLWRQIQGVLIRNAAFMSQQRESLVQRFLEQLQEAVPNFFDVPYAAVVQKSTVEGRRNNLAIAAWYLYELFFLYGEWPYLASPCTRCIQPTHFWCSYCDQSYIPLCTVCHVEMPCHQCRKHWKGREPGSLREFRPKVPAHGLSSCLSDSDVQSSKRSLPFPLTDTSTVPAGGSAMRALVDGAHLKGLRSSHECPIDTALLPVRQQTV